MRLFFVRVVSWIAFIEAIHRSAFTSMAWRIWSWTRSESM